MKTYDTCILIDNNPENLNSQNLAPLGKLKFDKEIQTGEKISMGYIWQDRLDTILYYRVIKIEKANNTKGTDKVVLSYLYRQNYPTIHNLEFSAKIRQRAEIKNKKN